jgi:hypothetical protein
MDSKKRQLSERDQSTHRFLKCVFPDKVTQDDAFLLIHVLDEIGEMSFRAIAHVIAALMDDAYGERDYLKYLHDVYGVGQREVDAVKAQALRERLYQCGFAEWIEE